VGALHRTDFAGGLTMKPGADTYAHRLQEYCKCGKAHSDIPAPQVGAKGHKREIAATYDYIDQQGDLLFQTVRHNPKAFNQRRPDGKGGWVWDLKGVRRVLYRLPELVASTKDPVFIVEGEKDVDRLISLGQTATTNPMGAGKWSPEYNGSLEGRHVVVIPDMDSVGQRHGQTVVNRLHGTAASVRFLELPGFP
jgi:putative DNA primase/helicase